MSNREWVEKWRYTCLRNILIIIIFGCPWGCMISRFIMWRIFVHGVWPALWVRHHSAWRQRRRKMEAFPHRIYVRPEPSEIAVLHPPRIYVSLNGKRHARPWQVHLSVGRERQGRTSIPFSNLCSVERKNKIKKNKKYREIKPEHWKQALINSCTSLTHSQEHETERERERDSGESYFITT